MPIISRERIKFLAKNGDTTFVREITVGSNGVFHIELPPDVVEALNETTVYGQTKMEAVSKFDEKLAAVARKKATTRKIVAYRVALWGEIGPRDPEEDTRNPIRYGDTAVARYDRRPGLGLSIEAGVFDETEVKDAGGHSGFRYEEAPSAIQSSARICIDDLNSSRNAKELSRRWPTQLPWTAEREAFFVRIVAGLENLLIELHGAFGDKDEVKALVDGKRGLLLLK